MECPICLELGAVYPLKGCSHSVCTGCAGMMAKQPTNQIQPFGNYIELNETFSCLICPLCRAKEPYPITPRVFTRLKQKYPEAYRIWFETALFASEDGTWYYTSRRRSNVVLLPNYDDDMYDLLDRIEFSSRTTSCWLDDMNLYANPDVFIQWVPIRYQYPCPQLYGRKDVHRGHTRFMRG